MSSRRNHFLPWSGIASDAISPRSTPGRAVRDRTVAARVRGISWTHVVRSFTREYGLPPHRYLIGRRIDDARRLLLAGMPIVDTASATGFHDQAHFTRHFRAMTGVTPGRYQRVR